jgi:hypothetical protein
MPDETILYAGPEESAPLPLESPVAAAVPQEAADLVAPPPRPAPANGLWSPPAAGEVLIDSRGRRLTLRGELSFLDEMDLRAIAGSQRDDGTWFTLVMVAARVSEIDGIPIRLPKSEVLIRAMRQMVDRSGIAALMTRLMPPENETGAGATEETQAKN